MNQPHSSSLLHETSVEVVIVNYRTGRLVVDCLNSLQEELREFPNAHVTVVDNQSQDGSVEMLATAIAERGWADRVELLEAPANGGFAYGNNQAVRRALARPTPPDFFWLLNPDTQARPGALAALVRFMAEHPTAGIAGGSFENEEGEIWPFAFRFPSVWSELERGLRLRFVSRLLGQHIVARPMETRPAQVDWLAGASLLVRKELFDAIGLMDEGYFLYFEETDFCLHAKRAGWDIWYVPESRVMHIAGQSTGITDKKLAPRRLPPYWFDSRARYFLKNHGRAYTAAADLAWAAGFALWRVRRPLQRKADMDPPGLLKDFVRHSSLLRRSIPEHRVKGAA